MDPDAVDRPETFDLLSADVAAGRRELLRAAFPEVFTEGGKVDFDRLRLALGEKVDAGRERYGLNWPGKAGCFNHLQTPSRGALRPDRAGSVGFDATGNVIIEGDNLETLKLLQKAYGGKVKMIYIDPPYNTGNDFIYPDDYAENLETYLRYTGQTDAEGRKFSTNPETDGRFHSRWLNMMYPRLYLARDLLREDGVVFISIDDGEVENLRRLCDELFGEENRVGIICWKNVTDNNPTLINKDNEFIVCYAKSIEVQPEAWRSNVSEAKLLLQNCYYELKAQGLSLEAIEGNIRDFIADNADSLGFLTRYRQVDEGGIYTGSESVHNPRAGGYNFEVLHPQTHRPMRRPANGYRFPESTFREMESQGVILYGEDENRIVKIKKYLAAYEDTLRSVIVLDGRLGSYDVKRLFPSEPGLFTNPKPVELVKSLVSYATSKDDLVLDFFGGSGTTAQAVLELNAQDGGNRRFLLVQLPEPTGRTDFPTIAEICRERVRRVLTRLNEADAGRLPLTTANGTDPDAPASPPDRGFRAYRLDTSGFRPWDGRAAPDAAALRAQLELHVDHLLPDRSADDLLAELLLKSGWPLTEPAETLSLPGGTTVHRVQDGALVLCLDRTLTAEGLRSIALLQPTPARVVCLDAGFAGDDALKTNAVQTMRSRGVTRFQTV